MRTYYYATIEKDNTTSATRNYKSLDKLLRKLAKKLCRGYDLVDVYEVRRKPGYYSATTL